MKRRFLYTILISTLLLPLAGKLYAQSGNTGWQLSLGGGFMNYYGDLSPYRIQHGSDWQKVFKFFQYNKHYVPEASWGISLEKRFTSGMGILFQANKGSFAMSDRYRAPNGDYDRMSEHWDRALNFKTDIWDAGLALTFHADNGKFLYSNAFFAPYFFIGAGFTSFKVKGDLYNSEGEPYNYANPGVEPDGKYETDLRPLMTETYKEYPNVVPYADLGIGVKLRLSSVVSLTLQSDIKYSFSDYLDDVSGKYKLQYRSDEQFYAAHPGTNTIGQERKRGYDDGVNDFYIFNKAALQFSIGSRSGRHHFKAPIIYNPGPLTLSENRNSTDSLLTAQKDSITHIRLRDSLEQLQSSSYTVDSIRNALEQLRSEFLSLRFTRIDQDYQIRQNEVQHRMDVLEDKKHALENKASLTKTDSLQLLQDQLQIDSLKIHKQAIQKAREQLRKEMGHTPVVTEYADSTKIIVYKEKSLPSYSKDTLDAVRYVPDSLQNKEDTTAISRSRFEQIQELYLTDRRLSDSLKEQQLQRSLDSLTDLQESLKSQYQQDSVANEPTDRNFIQRLLDKIRRNDRYNADLQQVTTEQKRQLQNNQEEIDQLQDELNSLKNNSRRYNYYNTPYGDRTNRDVRYLEQAVGDLYREQARQNRRDRLEIVPRIAPTIVTGTGERNNKEYEHELEAIKLRLDSLQAARATPSNNLQTTSSEEVDSLQNRLDSLQNLRARQQQIQQKAQVSTLQQQVDSLTQQLSEIKRAQAVADSQNFKTVLSNFPVISVYFPTGSSTLSTGQVEKLSPAAAMVKKHKGLVITLQSFTDATGSARINKIVSDKRSESVKDALIHKFDIPASQIQIGESSQSSTGRGSNPMQRRVDVSLKSKNN